MVEITIGNSYSQAKGLKSGPFSAIKKLLSYELDPQAVFFSGGWSKPKYLIDKHGSFPTGLASIVLDYLLQENIEFRVVDTRGLPSYYHPKVKIKGVKPYIGQEKAVEAALKAHRGIISMPTGTGKSLVIALIASRLNVSTLVVVPSLEIKKQLIDALNAFLEDTSKITVENIDSKALTKKTKYDCLIIDEAHHVAAETYQNLNKTAWTGIYYRFFLTATPFRNQANEELLFKGIAGDVIYSLSYKEAIKQGYIVPVEAFSIELPKKKAEGYTWNQVYNELIINNDFRNTVISNLLVTLDTAGKSTLCLVKEVKHGEILSKMTGFHFTHGQNEESRDYIRQFNNGGINILIGTTGILGEGVDSKPCEYVLIAGLGKAKSAFMQQVGRAVRRYKNKESAKIILFKDKSHKWTLTHFNTQVKILLIEYGITPTTLKDME